MMKILGALMILTGCGAVGFLVVASYRYQEQSLLQLIRILDYMSADLKYRMTPLPELCKEASQLCKGCVSCVVHQFGLELEKKIVPDAGSCMLAAVSKYPTLPEKVCKCMDLLGDSLGRFDLAGQLRGLASVKKHAEFEVDQLRKNQDVRMRSYQTLGICAGAALVVLLL